MKRKMFLLLSSLCAPLLLLALLAFFMVRNARATPSAVYVVNSVAGSGRAIDADNETVCPATDQRAVARPRIGNGEARCASGAPELSELYESVFFADLSLESPIAEGGSTRLTGLAQSSTAGDQLDLLVNWGDGISVTVSGIAPMSIDLNHTFADDGTYTMEVWLSNGAGLSDSRQLAIHVVNVSPLVDAGPDRSVVLGDPLFVAATFIDPGADTHTGLVDWGDGSIGTLTVVGNQVNGSHKYEQAGQYTVRVIVVDDERARGSDTFTVTISSPDITLHQLYLPAFRRN